MADQHELVTLLEQHVGHGWTRASPMDEASIAGVERKLGVQLPAAFRALLAYSGGGELDGDGAFVDFFGALQLTEFNPHPVWSKGLPGMIVFGGDQGEYIYYFDPRNQFGRGAWAVYGTAMGSSSAASSRFLAVDLPAFVRRVLTGDAVMDDPMLKTLGPVPSLR